MRVRLHKLHDDVRLPAYQTPHSAGMDIAAYVSDSVTIPPHGRAVIPTGFAIALPAGYEAQIRGRSGMAVKFGVMPANGIGTIDADYRGEIGVILLNSSEESFTVEPGMRIAQMVITKYEAVQWEESEDLGVTSRGADGYGSTGIRA